jgi:hypothetical protein
MPEEMSQTLLTNRKPGHYEKVYAAQTIRQPSFAFTRINTLPATVITVLYYIGRKEHRKKGKTRRDSTLNLSIHVNKSLIHLVTQSLEGILFLACMASSFPKVPKAAQASCFARPMGSQNAGLA